MVRRLVTGHWERAGVAGISTLRALSLAAKWTFAIALLLSLGMGLLGSYLIREQERAFDRQAARLGDLLAEQLARSAAEPLLADDAFALELLIRRQLDDRLVVGAAILERDGRRRIAAGTLPESTTAGAARVSLHTRPIRFQDLVAGEVVLGLNRAPLEQDRRTLIRAMAGTTLGLILLIGLLAFPLARWMSAPIRRLAVEREPTGDRPPAVPGFAGGAHRDDELGELARRIERLSGDAAGKRQVETVLHRYLSPGVVRSVLSCPEGMDLGGRPLQGSVLFCDIVDYTRLSRGLSPAQVGALVNDYFGDFARAGAWCGGTVDKFIGDCVMILFGVPEPDPQHALNAIVCGSAIVRLAETINVRRRALGQPTVQLRVAVNSGEMLAGNLGSRERMEFTVVGSSVNLASRLCERSPADCLVISADTLAEPGVRDQVQVTDLPPLPLKGYDLAVASHRVVGLDPAGGARVQDCLAAIIDPAPELA